MHPEMIQAMAVQQMGDRQAEAQAIRRVRLARQARKARRWGRTPDQLAAIRVPDYVDGTFRHDARPAGRTFADGAGSAAPAGGRGMPAGRDAA
jgi:hypothetical protein